MMHIVTLPCPLDKAILHESQLYLLAAEIAEQACTQ